MNYNLFRKNSGLNDKNVPTEPSWICLLSVVMDDDSDEAQSVPEFYFELDKEKLNCCAIHNFSECF